MFFAVFIDIELTGRRTMRKQRKGGNSFNTKVLFRRSFKSLYKRGAYIHVSIYKR